MKGGKVFGTEMKYNWSFENQFNSKVINYKTQNIFDDFLNSFYEMQNYERKKIKWPLIASQAKGIYHDQEKRQQGYIFCRKTAQGFLDSQGSTNCLIWPK